MYSNSLMILEATAMYATACSLAPKKGELSEQELAKAREIARKNLEFVLSLPREPTFREQFEIARKLEEERRKNEP